MTEFEFYATVTGPRAELFRLIFGNPDVPVISPLPKYVALSGCLGEIACLQLDLARITPEQRMKLVFALAQKFGRSITEVETEMNIVGVYIPVDECCDARIGLDEDAPRIYFFDLDADEDESESDEPPDDWDTSDLGDCCICGKSGSDVRNLVSLPFKARQPGTGWGCALCGLPADGAQAVLCDSCLEAHRAGTQLVWVCDGDIAAGKRIPYADLPKEPFDHLLARHAPVN